jgi:cytochrome c5
VIAGMLVAALLAAEPEAAAAGPRVETTALLAGKLPDGPGKAVLQAKCVICHSDDYVVQQRLTPAQWQAEVAKMRKFGAPIGDDEAKVLSEYLGRTWTVDLPERTPPKPVRTPRGAVPGK